MMINHIITYSLIIIFVLLIGKIFENKISACLKYALWLLVAVKLLLPFPGFESQFHILNFVETYTETVSDRLENMADEKLLYEEAVTADNNINKETKHNAAYNPEDDFYAVTKGKQELQIKEEDIIENKTNNLTALSVVAKVIYFTGVMVCFGAILISNLRFYKAFKKKRKYVDNYKDKIRVYKIEEYYGACLYGGFSPVIIVGNNTNLSMEQQHMVLLHEYVHYAHGDHIWSMIRNLCVALYWYNPLVWLAASVSRKDSELACDEGTIRRIGKRNRVAYGQMLLEVVSKASKKNNITSAVFLNSTTAARGKEEMKKRLSVIAKRKKASRVALALVIILSAGCIGCTLGEPIDEETLTKMDESGITNSDDNKETANEANETEKTAEEKPSDVDIITQNYSNAFEEEIILAENKYIWPTVSTSISSSFGERVHPITGEKKMLDYVGITGNQGDSIYAVADGDIIDVGYDNVLGNYIVLATMTGEEVTYGHLDGSKVPIGAQVKAGDIIGIMGKSGTATGTFLSISVMVNGEMADPMLYLELEEQKETITYNGKEYDKSQLCNATLEWLELSEKDRMLSSYFPPEFMMFDEKWGVTLTAEDVTSTGIIIICTQSGGNTTGELQTGSWYILENWTKEYGWKQMPYIIDGEIGWNDIAWIIPLEDTIEWEVNWEWLYGASGKYRIGKSITDFRQSGDFDNATYYAEFEIK